MILSIDVVVAIEVEGDEFSAFPARSQSELLKGARKVLHSDLCPILTKLSILSHHCIGYTHER